MTPQRRRAAILYAELRNFTRLSEVLEPAKVLQLANDFFTLAAKNVIAERGEVLSVQNDSLVAAFHSEGQEFAGWALKAAQAVQREFGTLGEKWKSEYGLPAAVGLGLHLGEAVFGMAGPLGKQQFVAFGDCVSIAERLVHRARTGEIVISLDVMKALGPAVQALGALELPALELSNRPPLPIYGMALETRLDFT
ncbi:MAG TPA: adenylate/guanylate cyclase domain-containing protein [Burkholderiales bacterium]|nr:adenylate/guanylate cyclase domain-containing protein [Burkholderiales bacterium]